MSDHYTSTKNACKLCSPLGASIVYKGIENCVPLIHGSQGCSTYIRRYMISHFREPIDIASSNFSEATAIFSGGNNIQIALENIITQYQPKMIGIATTCLSETIGDDVDQILFQYKKKNINRNLPLLVHTSTPSYRGTHMTGFSEAIYSVVSQLSKKIDEQLGINLISNMISPADIRHLKNILESFQVPYTFFPDYSDTLDGESWSAYQLLPNGGTPITKIENMGNRAATIELSSFANEEKSAAMYLEKAYGVTSYRMALPIGIKNTDHFFSVLAKVTGRDVPLKYIRERGRLTDAYIDAHKICFGKRAILFGEEDLVIALTAFLLEVGIQPVLIATGSKSESFKTKISEITNKNNTTAIISDEMDFVTMLEMAKGLDADLIIGNSKGYYLAKNLLIPLVRVGFPIHDRFGGQRTQHLCYEGTMQLFDRIINTLIESKQNHSTVGYTYFG